LNASVACTERITVRVTAEQRALVATGAALAGQSISAFVRTAALEAADRVLGRRDLIATIDAHLVTATRHPAGTTDRLRAPDRERPS
jgi:uncharacterized protein (DUF1778 family)